MLKIKDNEMEFSGEINYNNIQRFVDGTNIVNLIVRTDMLSDNELKVLLKELSENYRHADVKVIIEKVGEDKE